jgi:hypothetical protein
LNIVRSPSSSRGTARAAGTQIDDLRRARVSERLPDQRRNRLVQLERCLHEVQVIGRQIPDGLREPWLILELEEVAPLHP